MNLKKENRKLREQNLMLKLENKHLRERIKELNSGWVHPDSCLHNEDPWVKWCGQKQLQFWE